MSPENVWPRGFPSEEEVMARAFKLAIAALTVTTWTFLSFIYSSRPDDGEANALASLMQLPARLPASLPKAMQFETPKKKSEPIEMNTVEFKCLDRAENPEDSLHARWVRLSGKGCGKVNTESLTIRNLSNGYMATVFATSKHGLTTDYIPLVAGENKISMQIKAADGKTTEREFSLTRE